MLILVPLCVSVATSCTLSRPNPSEAFKQHGIRIPGHGWVSFAAHGSKADFSIPDDSSWAAYPLFYKVALITKLRQMPVDAEAVQRIRFVYKGSPPLVAVDFGDGMTYLMAWSDMFSEWVVLDALAD